MQSKLHGQTIPGASSVRLFLIAWVEIHNRLTLPYPNQNERSGRPWDSSFI
jgi:hypothetical protein